MDANENQEFKGSSESESSADQKTLAGAVNFITNCSCLTEEILIYKTLLVKLDTVVNFVYQTDNDSNLECRQCCTVGDITKLITCCACKDHFHSTCVGFSNSDAIGSTWTCNECKKCQICRNSADIEGRSLKCEQCLKVFHATCLRPIITSIPKFGWKCNQCRVCSDCGSRTPGAGISSRWHCHYSVCDSCYQQRNKGFSCPICHKAYRAAAYKEMVKCSWCNRFVHGSCDDEADLLVYHSKKEINPDYDYICPPCKTMCSNADKSRASQYDQCSTIDNSGPARMNQITPCTMESQFKNSTADNLQISQSELGISRGKPCELFKTSKKRVGCKEISRGRGGKFLLHKSGVFPQYNRKRGARGKGRNVLYTDRLHSDLLTDRSSIGKDIDITTDNKLLFCSAKDKFVLAQDICVMCGSVGKDQEGFLIACSQCGQCYHPYCVNVKITKVVLERGWRCLDCTVCEGCGQKNDEARLILCDDCDISYHIYCINPPLDTVPHGNWKCNWCAVCQKCGRSSPGKNSQWMNSFSECGPCASQTICCVCSKPYTENSLIIECANCERWLHCNCDSIFNEEDAQKCNNDNYHCILCRPRDEMPYHLADGCTNFKLGSPEIQNLESEHNLSMKSEHVIDGVLVSEHGFNLIKSLGNEIKKKRKMRLTNEVPNQDSGIIAAIESVVSGSAENVFDDGLDREVGKKKIEFYKDGMIWTASESSPPEGFSILTNDEGINILRKKRQRNLQKVGIGGFTVRNRAVKKEIEETLPMGENHGVVEKKKKNVKKKIRSKIMETFPSYLQEAFFGKDLLNNKASSSFWESDILEETSKKDIDIPKKEQCDVQKNISEPSTKIISSAEKTTTNTMNVEEKCLGTPFSNREFNQGMKLSSGDIKPRNNTSEMKYISSTSTSMNTTTKVSTNVGIIKKSSNIEPIINETRDQNVTSTNSMEIDSEEHVKKSLVPNKSCF